jgi:hypothetical protein
MYEWQAVAAMAAPLHRHHMVIYHRFLPTSIELSFCTESPKASVAIGRQEERKVEFMSTKLDLTFFICYTFPLYLQRWLAQQE